MSVPSGHNATFVVRVFRLGQEPADDLSAVTTAQQRLMMVWTLSRRMWGLTGRPLPTYARNAIPVQVLRRP